MSNSSQQHEVNKDGDMNGHYSSQVLNQYRTKLVTVLPYHLPNAEVWLFSPQTFHTLYGGKSDVFGY